MTSTIQPQAPIDLQNRSIGRLSNLSERLDAPTSVGPRALLVNLTGQSDGELALSVEDGVIMEVESEDGERSRELRRPGDDTLEFSLDQDEALRAAQDALSDRDWPSSSRVFTKTTVNTGLNSRSRP